MDRLTGGLLIVAVGIGLLAARDARRSGGRERMEQQAKSRMPPPSPKAAAERSDSGMAILRNDHVDDGMAVRSPFKGDPGITPPRRHGDTEKR